MTSHSPVVIAGTAAMTHCGLGVQAFWREVVRRPEPTPRNDGTMRRFVPAKPPENSRREIHSDHRLTAYLLSAIEYDLGNSLTALSDEERERMGVALGTAYGHLDAYLTYFDSGTEQGYRSVNPRHFPHTLANCGTVSVSDAYSIWGSSTTIATGLAAGFEAIAYAVGAIRRGDEDMMLAGAFDEVNAGNTPPYADRHRVSARQATDFPQGMSNRTCPGDGVGVLLLQRAESAPAAERRAEVELCATKIAHGLNWRAPDAAGKATDVITETLRDGQLCVSDITVVFPSGCTGETTGNIDDRLMQHLFGNEPCVDIVSLKPIIGDCFAAFGPLQCIAATRYLSSSGENQMMKPGNVALVYNAGYDGTFATALLRKLPV